jgi:polyferredoxin
MKKPYVRRTDRDYSQQLRLAVQLAFIALNVWIGTQFYLWVRHIESGGITREVARPAGVEGWLPIAALMNLKAFVLTGRVPEVHAAGMFLLIAFLAVSLVFRKSFCSWFCPIGTLSEYLWKLGRKAGGNVDVPRWLDVPLRGLKYALFGFFAWAVIRMPVDAIVAFLRAPFGMVADVKMLNFFRFLGTTGLIVIAVLLALSVLVKNFWCRYLCPYGALLGIVALASPARIRRDADKCIDCAKCAKACPARLPVDRLPQIRSAECTLCMQCTAVCPAAGALDVKVTPKHAVPAWAVAATIAVIFFGIVGYAKLSGHWTPDISKEMYAYFLSIAR